MGLQFYPKEAKIHRLSFKLFREQHGQSQVQWLGHLPLEEAVVQL